MFRNIPTDNPSQAARLAEPLNEAAEPPGAGALSRQPHHSPSPSLSAMAAQALGLGPSDQRDIESGLPVRMTDQALDEMARIASGAPIIADANLARIQDAISRLPPAEQETARSVADALCDVTFSRARCAPGYQPIDRAATPVSEFISEISRHLDSVESARAAGRLPPMGDTERQAEAVHALTRYLLRNEGEGALARCAGNLTATGSRAGIATFVGTCLRNLAAFHMQRTINAATAAARGVVPQLTREMINGMGGLMVALPPALHLAGGIRDAVNGSGTLASTSLRIGHSAVSLGSTLYGAATGNWNPMATWYTAVGLYSAVRGIGAAAVHYNSNAGAPGGRSLASATIAYSAAQFMGSFAQDSLGWNSGAGVESIRVCMDPGEGATATPCPGNPLKNIRSADAIEAASHDWGANLGHSFLNASLEIFDDLQNQGLTRAFKVRDFRAQWQGFGEEQQAQALAAGLRATVGTARVIGEPNREALVTAFASGIRDYLRTETEGLRMSFARQPTNEAQRAARAEQSVMELDAVGYRWNARATEGSPEFQRNRVIAAYVAQTLTQLELDQPLQPLFGGSRQAAATRIANQVLNVEPHRMNAFQVVFSAIYGGNTQLADPHRDAHANNAMGAGIVGAAIATVYPLLYSGLITRGPTREEANQAREGQRMVDDIVRNPDRVAQSGASARRRTGHPDPHEPMRETVL